MKLPKLHLVCSDDELRHAMTCVNVQKEFTYATNAHIAVRHKTSELFKEPFISTIPESGVLIPRRAWMMMCQKMTESVTLSNGRIELRRTDGSYISYGLVEGNFPDVEKVIPKEEDFKPVQDFALSSALLDTLKIGMGNDHPIVRMRMCGARNAIYVTPNRNNDNYPGVIGIILPAMVAE